jgi:four helix bundle protein
MDGAQLLARTERFALDGLAFYRRLSKSTEAQVPGVQFYKAATSSWSNYRASKRGQSRPHFITKLATAVEEIDEALGWLEFMDKGSIASDKRLLQEASELCAILTASLMTARANWHAELERRRNKRNRRALTSTFRVPDSSS